jgi:hypothetical protein
VPKPDAVKTVKRAIDILKIPRRGQQQVGVIDLGLSGRLRYIV